jgi:hypothetical protein
MVFTNRVCVHTVATIAEAVVDAPDLNKNTFYPSFEPDHEDYKHTPYFLKSDEHKVFRLDADF